MNARPAPPCSPRARQRRPLATALLPAALIAMLTALLLAGCGNKGPLVLPEAAPAGSQAESQATPDAAPPADAPTDAASALPPAPKTEPPAAHD
jgi:diaminopimelate decarboxylase